MQVTCEDQIEGRAWNPFDDPREMAEQQTKRCPLINQFVRPSLLRPVRRRVDPNHGYAFPTQNEDLRLIFEKSRPLEIANLRGTRERIAGFRDVVIA